MLVLDHLIIASIIQCILSFGILCVLYWIGSLLKKKNDVPKTNLSEKG
jgi:hypothetical protein